MRPRFSGFSGTNRLTDLVTPFARASITVTFADSCSSTSGSCARASSVWGSCSSSLASTLTLTS